MWNKLMTIIKKISEKNNKNPKVAELGQILLSLFDMSVFNICIYLSLG